MNSSNLNTPSNITGVLVYRGNVDHELKIDPDRLAEIFSGSKTHEIRAFDRDFKVGDVLKLEGYDRRTEIYTGDSATVRVTNITAPGTYGLPFGVGVMSISLVSDPAPDVVMADLIDKNNGKLYVNLATFSQSLSAADRASFTKNG